MTVFALWTLAVLASLAGAFRPLDDMLSDFRFSAASRPSSGDIVVLDIDSVSLREIGVWPWPRSVYAEALDRLAELGSAEIAFDVDFSSRSNEADDARLEAALEAAGGYAMLAAFQQLSGTTRRNEVNLPLSRFRTHAPPVGINVIADPAGLVRSFPASMTVEGTRFPSLATALTGVVPPDQQVLIDFAIDPSSVDRISFIEVLNGSVDPARILDKQVVIGASALELRDFFSVPRHGTLAGPVLQVLAAETLSQGRWLTDLGAASGILASASLALFLLLRRWTRLPLAGLVAGSVALCIGVETLALVLQVSHGLIVRTVVMHATELGFVIAALASEVALRRSMHAEASRERDTTRVILDRVIADNFDGVVVADESGRIVAASRLADQFFAQGRSLMGQFSRNVLPRVLHDALWSALTSREDQESRRLAEVELTLEGKSVVLEFTVTPSTLSPGDDPAEGEEGRRVACLTFHDITERKGSEARLRHLADHDALTGALSRPSFIERIDTLLAGGPPVPGLTVLILDLARFRTVNEALGHAHGDLALKEVYRRLSTTAALAVARMGGDHFALAFPGALDEAEIALLAADILALVTEPYHLGDHRAVLGAKIGVSNSLLSMRAELLLSHADMALSAAKSASGNTHAVFEPAMDQAISEKQALEVMLRNAIDASELTVLFQKQVSLATGDLVGVEALVRWTEPAIGAVSPGKFIPLAEETGLIVELGRWMLETACREVAALPAHIRLAVNISPVQFELSDVAADVAWALGQCGLEPERLDIEITEGIFLSNSAQVVDALGRIRALGVGVALDDFGTGYSSLSYLGRLPIDKIKIDQSFVRNLPHDPEAVAIVKAVVTLSHSLGKTVVAEGVETPEQRDLLRLLGCEMGQGYLFGRPESLAGIAPATPAAVQMAS